MDKSVKVQTAQGPVTVKKLALAEYAELIRALRNLPAEFANLFQSGKDISQQAVLFRELPNIIADSFPDFIAVISIGTDQEEETISKLDLAEALEIVEAMLEVNNYQKIVATVKKIMARGAIQEQTEEAKQKAKPAAQTK